MTDIGSFPHRLERNPYSDPREPQRDLRRERRRRSYGEEERRVLSLAAHRVAMAEVRAWPGYAPTPLRALPGLARRLGVDAVLYKDEGERFGLGAFKALGGAYAVSRLLVREVTRRTGAADVSSGELLGGAHRELAARITVACATAGNHGRGVAWGSELFGCRCVVFVPREVSGHRVRAIASHGADVVRVDGGYDEALGRLRDEAARRGWHVVSDKSMGPETETVARDVMQGYTVLVEEALGQLPGGRLPTHAFVQAGVGGLAAAVCAHFWERLGPERPLFVVVEAESADCLLRSARAGRPVTIEATLRTRMGGLACREPSPLAWRILRRGADFFLAVPDEASVEAMRSLAAGWDGDPAIVAGESGAAGAGGLLCVAGDASSRSALGLHAASRVLLIGTEGATDPAVYEEIVGLPPAEVAS